MASRPRSVAILCLSALTASGCAISYVDRETGATKTFGLLYVEVPPRPAVGPPLDVVDISSLGVALNLKSPGGGLVIGYNRSQLVRALAANGGSISISNGFVTCIAADEQCVRSLAAFNPSSKVAP